MADFNILVGVQSGDALRQLGNVEKGVKRVGNATNKTNAQLKAHANQYNKTAVATNKWAKGALQQAGYQVGDFFVQIQGGTNALQAFGQQGSQLLGIFGPLGAVLGAVVAIGSAMGTVFMKASGGAKELKNDTADLTTLVANYVSASEKARLSSFELTQQFGKNAEQARELFAAQKALNDIMAIKGMGDVIKTLGTDLPENVGLSADSMEILGDSVARMQAAFAELNLRKETMNAKEFKNEQRALAKSFGTLTDNFGEQIQAIQDVQEAYGSTADQAVRLMNSYRALESADGPAAQLQAVREVRVAYTDIIKANDEISDQESERLSKIIELETALLKQNVELGNTRKFTNEATQASIELRNAFNEAAFAAQSIGLSAQQNLDILQAKLRAFQRGASEEETRVLEAGIKAERAAVAAGVESTAELASIAAEAMQIERNTIAAENALKKFTETGKKIKPVKEKAIELTDEMKVLMRLSEDIGSKFESAFMDVVRGTSSVKDAFRSMAADIIAELYRVFVVKQITGFITDAVGLFMGPAPGSSGSISGGKRAFGGPVSANTPYLVGERGPELMIPGRSGTVVPNNQLGGGGVVVNQTINVSTGVQQTVRTEIKSLMPQIAESAKAAVADAKRRGGSYGRAFA